VPPVPIELARPAIRPIGDVPDPEISMRLLLVLSLLALPTLAEARGLPLGRIEDLHFVSATSLTTAQGAPLALCHRSLRYHLLLLGIWRQSLGYSLATDDCDSRQHTPIADAEAQRLRDQYVTAQHIPVPARFSATALATGFGWWPIILILGLALWRKNRQARPAP
jgi:hypothetical protein